MPDAAVLTKGERAMAVADLLEEAVRRYPAKPAMAFMGRSWRYAELGDLVGRVARGLQAIGVDQGVRVGLCLPNTPYSVIFYYAVLRIGGIVVNFNPLYVERELRHQIHDSGTRVMVVPDLAVIYDKVAAVAAETGLRRIVVCPMAGIMPFAKAVLFRLLRRKDRAAVPADTLHVRFAALVATRAAPTPVAIAPDDAAVLQYTGGTTGTPKGATLTHAALTANCRQVLQHCGDVLHPGDERFLVVLPLFHVFAMTAAMNLAVTLGGEMILLPRFQLRQVLAIIEHSRPTIFPAVPTIFSAINGEPGIERRDLSSIRFCISGGAPLPADVRARFESLTGCRVIEGYGLSETSPVVCLNPPSGVRDGSVGIPVPGTAVEIRDPDGAHHLLGPGERGEICVRGPQVMTGYWGRPDETASVMVEGAFRTGDIGYRDADGYVFLMDRIKDMILCSGYSVYPRVLEEALYQHPAVAEAVVIGVPDPQRGEAPKAFVTLRRDMQASPEDLRRFLVDYVSRIEMPKQIEIRDQLPKTMVGKLSKKELIAEEARKAAQAGTGQAPSGNGPPEERATGGAA